MIKRLWTIWKFAIGSFSDEQTAEFDTPVAIARTFIVGINVICAILIMTNIIVGWIN